MVRVFGHWNRFMIWLAQKQLHSKLGHPFTTIKPLCKTHGPNVDEAWPVMPQQLRTAAYIWNYFTLCLRLSSHPKQTHHLTLSDAESEASQSHLWGRGCPRGCQASILVATCRQPSEKQAELQFQHFFQWEEMRQNATIQLFVFVGLSLFTAFLLKVLLHL